MKLSHFVLTLTLFVTSTLVFADTTKAPSFNSDQVNAIEKIVHDYLVSNPQVLIEATTELQKQQMKKIQDDAKAAIPDNAKNLFNNPNSPVIGNPKGSVTLVEFLDYQCSHCRDMNPVIAQLIKDNPNLKVVIKNFPIFGANSVYAAEVSIAANKQQKFQAISNSLFETQLPLSQDKILEVAKKSGLNMDQLEKDMKDPSIATELKDNDQLAQALKLRGTPAFIVVNTASHGSNQDKVFFYPGAADAETLQGFITKAGS